MRSRLRAQRRAPHADPRGAVQFVRLRRNERHAGFLGSLTATPALRLELRPSPRLAAAIVAAWGAAGAGAWLALPAAAGWSVAVLGLALGCASAHDRGLLRGRGAPRAIELRDGGEASIERADGARIAVRPGARHVGRHAVILGLQSFSRRRFLVAADMLDAEAFRRLRLWALWGRSPAGAPARPQG